MKEKLDKVNLRLTVCKSDSMMIFSDDFDEQVSLYVEPSLQRMILYHLIVVKLDRS